VDWIEKLEKLGPCEDALDWAAAQPTAQVAWESCHRGDWLLWTAAMVGVNRREVVQTLCACARIAPQNGQLNDDTSLQAIKDVERWCNRELSLSKTRAAASQAYAVEAYAAYCAARAADDEDDEGGRVYASNAAATAYYASRQERESCVALIRQHITWELVAAAAGLEITG
jgi:hypothetical protein